VSSLHALDTAVLRSTMDARSTPNLKQVRIDQASTALQPKWTRRKLSRVQEVYDMSAHLWISLLQNASLSPSILQKVRKSKTIRGDWCLSS